MAVITPIGYKEYEAMSHEEHENAQLLALCDLPKGDKGDVYGATVVALRDYLKIADKLTGARVAQWDFDSLIGQPPRRVILVDQSDAEVAALLRAWHKDGR